MPALNYVFYLVVSAGGGREAGTGAAGEAEERGGGEEGEKEGRQLHMSIQTFELEKSSSIAFQLLFKKG